MFGCGNYPAYPEIRKSITDECEAQVKRLRHHPSIVIYAGNNEDYQVQEQCGLTYDYKDKDPENWLKTDFPARYIYEKVPSLCSNNSKCLTCILDPTGSCSRPFASRPLPSRVALGRRSHLIKPYCRRYAPVECLARHAREVSDLRHLGRPIQLRIWHGGLPSYRHDQILCHRSDSAVPAVTHD